MLRRNPIITIHTLAILVFGMTLASLMISPAAFAGGQLAADLSLYGNPGFSGMGSQLSEAGDVNGDGYSDFAVANDRGTPAVRVYYGSSVGPNQFSYTTIPSPPPASGSTTVEFGFSIAAGDLNNDGYCDLVIGAPGSSEPNQTAIGRVYVFLGSSGGIHTTPDQTINGFVADSRFGSEVAPAGDVNADGYYDFAVAEARYPGAVVRLFLGGSGLLTASTWTYTTNDVRVSIDAAGDVNADGYDDLVLGDDRVYHAASAPSGSAYVFLGSSDGLSALPDWEWYNVNENFIGLADRVAGAGDVNGDGYADILVTDFGFRVLVGSAFESRGRAMLFLGGPGGPSYSIYWDRVGDVDNGWFGADVSPAGDVNGDGYADFLVGSLMTYLEPGRTDLYLGSPTGIVATGQFWVAPTLNSTGAYSAVFATAGDVNGDGFADWIGGSKELDFYGRVDLYLGHGDLPSTAAAWSLTGGSSGVHLGASMAADGDANLDGFSDLLIGKPGQSGLKGAIGSGGVELYYGSTAGPVSSGWARGGTSSGDSLGAEVAFIGDTNGDNAGELAVAAPYTSGGGTVSIYSASTSGPSTVAYRTLGGTQAGEAFGHSIAGIGDVDGDGYADVVVGSPNWDGTSVDNGRVQLFFGSSSGLSTTAQWQWSRGGRTGWDCTFGDFNRDGFSDLAVSSPTAWADISNPLGGIVDIFYGSAGGFAALPDLSIDNGEAWSTLGWVVTSAGDVDGDGFEDLAIGAPKFGANATGMPYGRAYVHYGSASGVSPNPAWWRDGSSSPSEQYGIAMAGVGDLDGDGADELAVGSLDEYVEVFRGYVGGTLTPIPALTLTSSFSGNEFGRVIAGKGNIDGDAFADFYVGRPLQDFLTATDAGGALWYRGGTGEIANVALDRSARQIGSVSSLARLGRSPNNSMAVRTILRSPAGATDQRLQTRTTVLSSEIITAPVQSVGSWVHTRNVDASGVLGGLSTLSPYHWQVRGVTRNPRFPHTPWRTLAGASVNLAHFRSGGTVLRPDLVAASALPDSASNLTATLFSVEVLNQGLGPAGATHTRIAVDGVTRCDLVATPSLGVGASTFVDCNLGVLSTGPHTVTVTVDVADEDLESNESNNVSTFTVQVVAPHYLLVRADGSGDVPTIADAIAAIAVGGVVELADGTFTGTGNHSLHPAGKDLTIRSQSGDAVACVIDAQANSGAPRRILLLDGGETAAFAVQNITFTGGYNTGSGGAVRLNASAATFESCRFVSNHSGSGAGVYAINSPPLSFTNCEFSSNDCTNAGAGVYLNTTQGTFTGCSFLANTATWGGALYLHSAPSTIYECLFVDNVNPNYGGAIEINHAGAVIEVDQSTFHGNGSPTGAHFFVRDGATLNLHRSILSGGTQGDPIVCANGTEIINIDCTDIWGNSAGNFVGCIAGMDADPAANNFSSDPYYCDAAGGVYTLDTASACTATNSPCGTRVGAFDDACTVVAVGPTPEVHRFGLAPAHPNPFNPRTTIRFELEERGLVDLVIYDVSGRRVRVLLGNEDFEAGSGETVWDGTDDRGESVASGVYLVRLRAGGRSAQSKIALIR